MSETPRPRRRLMSRLVGSFLSLSLLTVLFVALFAFFEARGALRDALFDRLTAVTEEMEGELGRWIERQRDLVVFVAWLPDLRREAAGLTVSAGNDIAARERAEALLSEAAEAPGGFEVLSLLSVPAGRVIASTDPERRGVYHVNDYFYERGKSETFVQNVYTSPLTARPTITIASPVRDQDGRTIGVLAGDLDLELLDRLTAGRTGIGRTGEVYLVSAANDFVSSARFGREEFRRGVFSEGIDRALERGSGVGVYANYAGDPVIGAYRWSPELELALIVEMKQTEAFAPAKRLVETILAIGIASALLLAGGVYLLARQIARPVLALTDAAIAVAEGDFDARAPVLTADEVGVLAGTFNAMTSRLRDLYADLSEQVDARTRALDALEKSQHLLRAILDNSATLIAVTDAGERFLLLNQSFANALAVPASELVGRPVGEVLPAGFARQVLDNAAIALREGRVAEREVEVALGGDERTYLLVSFPLAEPGVAPKRVGMVATDLTERKKAAAARQRLEAQVLHAQKLESLGLMAGGIAHDFNNILTVISGNAELALLSLEREGRAHAQLEKLLRATRQAAELTGQMLAYAGKASFDQDYLDLNGLVRETLTLLEASVSKKISIRCELSATPAAVRASRAQLTQLVLNLATNAAEAIGDDVGSVAIETSVLDADGPRVVRLSVEDTGTGMDELTRERIFDPFFSTKGPGRGIGLAAVAGIARSAGAEISVASRPGGGTRFVVVFPAAVSAPRTHPADCPVSDAESSTGTILVVDDEPLVRDVARELLERAGYDVIEARDGLEAVETYRARTGTGGIDAVLLDLTMPGMGGADTLRALRQLDPDVRAILTSGYDSRSSVESASGEALGDVLQKPYRADTLLARVRALLSATSVRAR